MLYRFAALLIVIVAMITLDAVHAQSGGTSLTFAFRPTDITIRSLFAFCLGPIAVPVVHQAATLRMMRRFKARGL